MAEGLNRAQVQAAMKAMMDKAMETPNEPIAMCIVDATGNLEAYAKMDNLRLFSRRHAQRKAYTSAVMGMDSGAHAERLHGGGRNIADLGDPMMTHGQGGLVIMKDGVILGWDRSWWLPQRPSRRGYFQDRTQRNEPLGR